MNQGRVIRLLKDAVQGIDFTEIVKEAITEHLEDLDLEKVVEEAIEKAAADIKDHLDELTSRTD